MTFTPGAGKLPRDQNSVPAAGAASLADINSGATSATILPLVIDNATNRLLVTAEITSGGTTQYAEDTQTTAADKITMAGVVRADTPASLVDTDGDRTQLIVNNGGRLWVSANIDSALPAGTNAIGKLAANDGVDIGDVTVNNAVGNGVYIRPGTGVNMDTSNVTIGAALPAGAALLGKVGIDQTTPGTTNRVAADLYVASAAVAATNPVSVASGKATASTTSTGVTVGTSSTTIIASNANRKSVIIVNDGDETIYLKYGSAATTASGIRLNASGGSLREDLYTGIITGICASGGKNVTVTEI